LRFTVQPVSAVNWSVQAGSTKPDQARMFSSLSVSPSASICGTSGTSIWISPGAASPPLLLAHPESARPTAAARAAGTSSFLFIVTPL